MVLTLDIERLLIASSIYSQKEYDRRSDDIIKAYGPMSEIKITWLESAFYYHHNQDRFSYDIQQTISVMRPDCRAVDKLFFVRRGDGGLQLMFIPELVSYKEKMQLVLSQVPAGYMQLLQAPPSVTTRKILATQRCELAVEAGELEVGMNTEFLKFELLILHNPDHGISDHTSRN